MPLRDHFHSPLNDRHSWDEVHGQWPAMIVLQLFSILPAGYEAAPRFQPSLSIETDLPEQDEYEVRVYDAERGRRLVAAIEMVSPGNKDRQEHRQAFVAKCLALLQQGVCVSIVDLVTIRDFNFYAELLRQIGHDDPALGNPPPLYAVTCRTRSRDKRSRFETWTHPLAIGEALRQLPIWLAEDLHVTLDLEASYEQTCRVLRIA